MATKYATSICACTFLPVSLEELRQFHNAVNNDVCSYHREEINRFSVICFRRQEIHVIVQIKKLVFTRMLLDVWEIVLVWKNPSVTIADNVFSFLSSV